MSWTRLPWAKMPSAWISERMALRSFQAGSPGPSIAALKLYLTILGEVRHGEGSEGLGCARLSYTQLETLADLSRSMIRPGLDLLTSQKLVRAEVGDGRTHVYAVTGYPPPGQPGWRMIPIGHLRRSGFFQRISARSKADLAALKVYFVLATFRDGKTGETSLSYEKINHYTGVGRNDVSRALSRLVDLDTVRIHSGRDSYDTGNQGYNRYELLGLGQPKREVAGSGWSAVGSMPFTDADQVDFG